MNFSRQLEYLSRQLDISSDMGNKLMVFSGKGAKLIDALTLPPVNNAGSLYINHNGIDYEPILRV